jgi:hypothetical protein
MGPTCRTPIALQDGTQAAADRNGSRGADQTITKARQLCPNERTLQGNVRGRVVPTTGLPGPFRRQRKMVYCCMLSCQPDVPKSCGCMAA